MVQKRRLYKYSVDTFIELLQQITKRKKINYKCNDADTNSWNDFIEAFPPNIGEEFIRNFIQFGFQSWFNDSCEKDYSRQIRFNWIFGKKAIERWNKNSISTNIFMVRSSLKKKYHINTLKKKTQINLIINTIRPVEENFKSEYYNTKRGLLWCIANTTLYFHKSSKCVNCVFKKECKELLKQEFPKIYVKRGYGSK